MPMYGVGSHRGVRSFVWDRGLGSILRYLNFTISLKSYKVTLFISYTLTLFWLEEQDKNPTCRFIDLNSLAARSTN